MLSASRRSFLLTLTALSTSPGSAQTPAKTPIIGFLAGIAQPATVRDNADYWRVCGLGIRRDF